MKRIAILLALIVLNHTLTAQTLAFRETRQNNLYLNKNLFDDGTGQTQTFEKKSVGLGIIYSLLLPGMGELYAGDYSLGKYFTIADATLWIALFGFNYYASAEKDNYIAFAATHAFVNPNGKDDDYWGTIGNYDDIYIYNDEMDLMREFDKLYDPQTHYWKWDEVANRKKYRSMRNASETAYNNMKFVASALILNRIASAIDATLLIKRINKSIEKADVKFGVGVNYVGNSAVGLSLNIAGKF